MRLILWTRVALVVVVLLGNGCRSAQPGGKPDGFVEAMVGDTVCRPDGQPWDRGGGGAFVIVMSPKCGACQTTRDFSDELDAYGAAHGRAVIYIMPNRPDLNAGAEALSAAGKTVIRASLHDFGVIHMPTYLRVSGSGVIESRWTGSISGGNRERVFSSVVEGTSLDSYQVIGSKDVANYSTSPNTQTLALSELGKRPGSKVIPFAELDIRAEYELRLDSVILVDCGTTLHPWQCQEAAMDLKKAKFSKVIAVDLPKRSGTCPVRRGQ